MTGFDGTFGHWPGPSVPSAGKHLGDLLSAVLDGELSRSAAAAATLHLSSCPTCAAELEDVRTAQVWVRALPTVEPPFGFLDRLALEPPDAGRRRLPPRWVGVAALAASAAAAFGLLGIAPPREAPVSPSVNRMVEAQATGASFAGDPLSRLAPIGVPVTFTR
jgi:anti-sigma factor RsiW